MTNARGAAWSTAARPRVLAVSLVGLSCACALGLTLPEAAAASATTPSATAGHALQRSLAAATKAGTARITVQFFSGSTTGKVVQDSALRSGKQTVAIGKELASVILVGGSAYISGNDRGLTSFFGLSSAMLSGMSGRWAALQPSDPLYSSVTANVTLSSALANITPKATLALGKRSKIHGQWTRSISGEAPGGGHLVLFVRAKGQPLPVEAVETSGTGETGRGEIVSFNHWGEKLQVAKPSSSVPFSTLQAIASAS